MKYDVFISYSRKDTQQLQLLLSLLKRDIPSLKIWYDVDGVESASDFQSRIIDAIDDSHIVLFICSEHSLDSEYCRKEIMYAKNTEKTVIPYLLPGMKLKKWLLFEFGNINCISSTKEDEVSRMIIDIKRWSQNIEESLELPAFKDNSEHKSINENIEKRISETEVFAGESQADKGFINCHEYVDLGLPSGLKWATCNVGASTPEDFGDYFAWGEIKPKSAYIDDNAETYNKNSQWLRSKGYIDINGNLTPEYDAARQNWGASWRMPTLEDIDELINNTTCEPITQNGVAGRLLKSKMNGNSVFLPAGGWRNCSSLKDAGLIGNYWSSTLFENDSKHSYHLRLDSSYFSSCWFYRFIGYSVRPVSE